MAKARKRRRRRRPRADASTALLALLMATLSSRPVTAPVLVETAGSRDASQAKKDAFVKTFGRTGNITAAALSAEIDRRTYYRWRQEDPGFAQGVRDAAREARDRLILELRRRGEQGWEEPVIREGQIAYQEVEVNGVKQRKQVTVRKYSDACLIFLTKVVLGVSDGARTLDRTGNPAKATPYTPDTEEATAAVAQLEQAGGDVLYIDVVDGEEIPRETRPLAASSLTIETTAQ